MTQTKSTDISTAQFEGGEELIQIEQIGIFRLVKNKVNNTVALGIGDCLISDKESENELRAFAENFDDKMINTIIVLLEFIIKNSDNLKIKIN